MPNVDPQWSKAGNLWDSTESEITATGALTGPGYIHMIILEDEEDDVEPPSAQQIVWGLDSNNDPVIHAFVYYDGTAQQAFLSYSGLNYDTIYKVYFASENDYPGNNKAVSSQVYEYVDVRTDAGEDCNPCDDPYYLADDLAYHLSVGIFLVWLN